MILIKKNLLFTFIFFLPLHIKVSTLILVLLVIVSIVTLLRGEAKVNLKFKPYLASVLLYIILGASMLYSENAEFRYLEQKASLFAIPLIFFTFKIDKATYRKVLCFFVFGCFAAVLCCYANAIYASINWVNGELVFQAVVNDEFSFFYSVVRDGNYFFSSFFSIFHDTIYFAMFLNTAIAVILSESMWKKSKWYLGLLFLFTLVVFQLSSKIGIVTCILIYVLFTLLNIKKPNLRFMICMALVLFGVAFFHYNPRGNAMIDKFEREGLSINPKERFGYSLRLMSWDAGLELIAKNPIFGVGIGDVKNELNKKYLEKEYQTPLKQNLNAHSQFLQITLEVGLAGLLLLLYMFYFLLRSEQNFFSDQNFFDLALFVVLFLAFLFESTFSRYSGISFFMLFYCLVTNKRLYVPKP